MKSISIIANGVVAGGAVSDAVAAEAGAALFIWPRFCFDTFLADVRHCLIEFSGVVADELRISMVFVRQRTVS